MFIVETPVLGASFTAEDFYSICIEEDRLFWELNHFSANSPVSPPATSGRCLGQPTDPVWVLCSLLGSGQSAKFCYGTCNLQYLNGTGSGAVILPGSRIQCLWRIFNLKFTKKKKSTGVLGIKAKTKKKCLPRQDSLEFFFSLIK